MDFSFTEEQQMLRDGLGRYLEKDYDFDARQAVVRSDAPYSREAWAQYAEFGLLALPFSEDAGGLGGSISDCVAVAELMGKHITLEPYTGAIICAGAVLAASETEAAHGCLEKLIAGNAVVAFAYEESHGTPSLEHIAMIAQPSGNGFTLNGKKRLVVAGADADALVVVARMGEGGGHACFLVDPAAQGVGLRGYPTIDGLSAADVRFENVEVGVEAMLLSDAKDELTAILRHAITVMAAEAVGAMGALLAITAEYAATRKQFGVPIASFQAIGHRLADMKIAYTKARATMIYTTALVQAGVATSRDIAVMKGQVGKLGRAIGEAAIQTHGGVGMTDELSVSHYHKRLLAFDTQMGNHAYHLRMVGRG